MIAWCYLPLEDDAKVCSIFISYWDNCFQRYSIATIELKRRKGWEGKGMGFEKNGKESGQEWVGKKGRKGYWELIWKRMGRERFLEGEGMGNEINSDKKGKRARNRQTALVRQIVTKGLFIEIKKVWPMTFLA